MLHTPFGSNLGFSEVGRGYHTYPAVVCSMEVMIQFPIVLPQGTCVLSGRGRWLGGHIVDFYYLPDTRQVSLLPAAV